MTLLASAAADTDRMTYPDPTGADADVSGVAGLRPGASRNVIDRYKAWETEQIKADLETRRTALVSVTVNFPIKS